MTPEASLTCIRGNAIKIDGDGEAIIHPLATTVDDFYGIALCDVTAGVSDSPSGELQVARCTTSQTFCGQVVAGGVDADVVLTDLSGLDIGDAYGLIINTATEHMVDFSDTTNVVLRITKIDDDLDLVWFQFLAAAVVITP
jgi:hypothetical protein